MIVLSFRTKKDKTHMLKKVKEMQEYVDELVECLEEAESEEYGEDDYYNERSGYRGSGSTAMRSRYGYRRM